MKKILIATMALGLLLVGYSVSAAEVDLYGSVNYKVSNDDDSTGKAVLKAQNNGSIIGVDFSETLVEGQTGGIKGFGKIEVGVDADDSGSDTFDSRLAYVGVDAGPVGSVSMGRQANPGAGVSKTNIFNVYGANATFNYADRTSNTVKYSNSVGPVTVDALAVIDGATGKDGIDVVFILGL
jgi:predicted porin